MAGNIVLATGLLISICVQSGIVSSEVVPDRLVYTEVKKTLVQGIPGVLTCRFYRDPQAIYWKKGSNPEDASLLLLWHEGEVSGQRYDDGSCDIDENYSLIIKNVSLVDAGRYYCLVSNYLGILINNYTDVSVVDNAIDTKSQVTLQIRPYFRGVLQCSVHIRPRMVSWIKKSTTSSSDEVLAIFEDSGTVVKRSGVGYDEGMYNISEDYSLVINGVQVHNEGIYTCNVTDFDTGISFQDDTRANVVAQPREPFPTILECLHGESDLSYCSLDAETALTITCLVSEYYPDIHLIFLYGSEKVEILETTERNNIDGTKNKTITIASRGSKELYTCVASNIPGTPSNRSISALLHDKEHSKILMAVLIPFLALIFFSSVTCVIWRKKHSKHVHTEDCKPADSRVLKKLVNEVLTLHYHKIRDFIEDEPALQTENAIDEIKNALLVADQMCTDCHKGMLSSQLTKAIETKDTAGERTAFAWPSDEELKWISCHLTPKSMTDICKKLKIIKFGDADSEMCDRLRKWRNKMINKSVDEKHKLLLSALESNNLRGLLPPVKGRYIYKAELVDMAFQLLMQDLLPFSESLCINSTKLVSYRPAFQPFHLEIGTINLLSQLLESIAPDNIEILEKRHRRLILCNRIGKLHSRKVATCGVVVYDMSYGELSSVLEAMMQKTAGSACQVILAGKQQTALYGKGSSTNATSAQEGANVEETDNGNNEKGLSCVDATSTQKGDNPDETDLENNEKGRLLESKNQGSHLELPKDLVDLRSVLQLTDQDIADGLGSSHLITAHALFRIWREKPRQSVFNYRAALALGLKEIDLSDLADDVIAGKYIHEKTSLEFIQKMVQGLTRDQLRSLGNLLGLSRKDKHWHARTPLDVISQQIYEWVADWTKEMKNSWYLINVLTKVRDTVADVTPLRTTLKEHKELNDKLVKHGFLDLAREIMIIEQQLGYVEPNLMSRIANMMPQDLINQMGNMIHKSKFSQLFAQ